MSEEKPIVQFEDFKKLDLRIAKIVEVSDHPNADKLTVMKIDIGGQTRQIIAGIRGYYAAEALLGKEVVVVLNLAPRKVRGMESQGMLLAAIVGQAQQLEDVVLLSPDKEVPPGSPVT